MDRQAKPVGSQVRKLIAATLALIGCRVVSQWNSLVAGFAALVIILVLAVSIIAGMPRVRRLLLIVTLPASTLANAVALSLGTFIMLLGMQGLLVDGRIGHQGPPWNLAFALVPLSATTNLIWLARSISTRRWLRCIGLANLAPAGYSVWAWYTAGAARLEFPPPAATAVLVGLAVVSLATLALDAHAQSSSTSKRPGRARRMLVPATAVMIILAFGVALVPVYRKRQVARSLEPFGMRPNFEIMFPSWKALPFDLHDYLGEVTGVAAPDALKGDASQAGCLLKSLPSLDFVIVNRLPTDGERILAPLAGHTRLRQIGLVGEGVTDETLADAANIPALNRAYFRQARITDEGLAKLTRATWLQALSIYQTRISGDGLVYLGSLPRLSELNLTGTDVGDPQLAELPRFKALVDIWLDHTRVTDDGLASLAQCKKLKLIDLSGTRVTESGVDQLRRALPNCDVVWRTADE